MKYLIVIRDLLEAIEYDRPLMTVETCKKLQQMTFKISLTYDEQEVAGHIKDLLGYILENQKVEK